MPTPHTGIPGSSRFAWHPTIFLFIQIYFLSTYTWQMLSRGWGETVSELQSLSCG